MGFFRETRTWRESEYDSSNVHKLMVSTLFGSSSVSFLTAVFYTYLDIAEENMRARIKQAEAL